ncbi:UNVERIFIED_ORG: hypothetical protein FHR35_003411 [Microbispora rosea subsp. rosea]
MPEDGGKRNAMWFCDTCGTPGPVIALGMI